MPKGLPSSLQEVSALDLLKDALIRYRTVEDGTVAMASLPELMQALGEDQVRDFPGVRPHQLHPWYALLVQLAAIALDRAGRTELFSDARAWSDALSSLTEDRAAWCLVSPDERPAFLQPPVQNESVAAWKSQYAAADDLDMLVTSRNHDLKTGRAVVSQPEDWLFALVSLQLQEGFLGQGNYGISRMNGGFASRPGVGLAVIGALGQRWRRDVLLLCAERASLVEQFGFAVKGGPALLWTIPWDGLNSLTPASLDPIYIEVCRRIRLRMNNDRLSACGTSTKAPRIAAKEMNGMTGDPWTPIDVAEGKALTITREGFHYRLVSDLLFSGKYQGGIAQSLKGWLPGQRLKLVARGITRGQGKTEGFHHREVPISPKIHSLLASQQRDLLAKVAAERVQAIAAMRKILWSALVVLFDTGVSKNDPADSVKDRANRFSSPFEKGEDKRFFEDLTAEIDAEDPAAVRLSWLLGMIDRAEALLRRAFDAGPRSGMRRYRAQSSALGRFHSALRGNHSPTPQLAEYLTARRTSHPEELHEHA